jgi:hypothetical protein
MDPRDLIRAACQCGDTIRQCVEPCLLRTSFAAVVAQHARDLMEAAVIRVRLGKSAVLPLLGRIQRDPFEGFDQSLVRRSSNVDVELFDETARCGLRTIPFRST